MPTIMAPQAGQAPSYPTSFPPQHQNHQPGVESQMNPRPFFDDPEYRGAGKLKDKVTLITGGDSGIGRAVAVAFAKEGADVVIAYRDEEADAVETVQHVERYGRRAQHLAFDVSNKAECDRVVRQAIAQFGKVDILVNNAARQHPQPSILDITPEQLQMTFATNVFGYFYMIQAALPHMKPGACIINTASITAYRGHETLIDYAATKGAIVSLTRSLALSLAKQGIRVNAVAPGPVWTPLIPASFAADEVAKFGTDTPMGRAGQPAELAPAYVFLASANSSYMTGQVLHVNGGEIVNG